MGKCKCEICHIKTRRLVKQKRIFMAKFPLDEERCRKWVAATGNQDLIYVPIEKLHQLKYICGKHFRPKDFKKKKTRLRKRAVPCIDISKNPLTDDEMKEFPLHIAPQKTRHFSIIDHNYHKDISDIQEHSAEDNTMEPFTPEIIFATPIEQPSTWTANGTSEPIYQLHVIKQYTRESQQSANGVMSLSIPELRTVSQLQQPSTSINNGCTRLCVCAAPGCGSANIQRKTEGAYLSKRGPSISEHISTNREPEAIKHTTENDKKIADTTCKLVNGSCSHLKTIAKLEAKVTQLNKRLKLQRQKLKAAENLSLNKTFSSLLDRLPENIKYFTKLQLQWEKKPHARRFTTEEKEMGLSLFKENPKEYRLLRKMCVLPSIRSLQVLASQMNKNNLQTNDDQN